MNDLTSTADRADPPARARALGAALAAASDEIERTQRIPEPLLTQLHEARLFRLLLPRSAGGDEVEPWVYLAAVEEIARHDGSVAWNVFVGNSSALIAPFLAADGARAIYADPRSIIAWGPPNSCRAQAVPGGYRVSGRWDFASGCRQANWMGAHGLVVEPDGSLRLNRRGRPTVRTLLFPATQATLLHTWNVIGLRGTASDSYTVDDVFVPEAFSGTREDPALRREPGRLYAFTMQGIYAVGVAAVGFGLARAMLEAFIELADRKAPRYLSRLADSAVVQASVARMQARLDAARAYLVDTLKSIWDTAGAEAPIDVPDRARVRLACAHGIETAEAVVDYVYKAAGTDSIFLGSAFERRFRDMHTLSQQIQSRAAHFETVGQILLGIEQKTPFL
ncbi:MAG: acyl-CoA dehydrogenase family protein [Alphaproteobacteria bacterium]|nr:acyl-CoA dehydrogenase family protein [Alphaproteobacteria bacterium]